MGLGGLAGKAQGALDSEKGERLSDTALEKGEGAASQATGGKHDEQLGRRATPPTSAWATSSRRPVPGPGRR